MNLETIREGMQVVDNAGQEVGSVHTLKMGDPNAASSQGQDETHGGVFAHLLEPLDGSALDEVPAEERQRLLRMGYVEIQRRGLLHRGSLLVASDEIDRIEDDTIHLSIGGHDRRN